MADWKVPGSPEGDALAPGLSANLAEIQRRFGESDDLIVRRLTLGIPSHPEAAVVYLQGAVNEDAIARHIIQPLTLDAAVLAGEAIADPLTGADPLQRHLVSIADSQKATRWSELLKFMPMGSAVLLIDGIAEALLLRVRRDLDRAISEPESASVVRGPREGFIEHLQSNIALVRRRIRTSDLRVRSLLVGERTQTRVAMLYLHGVAEEGIVQEVHRRLSAIKIDGVLESGYIEEQIQDHPYSIFPTVRHNERVDIVLGNILEGRVAILTDGTPFALIVPATFPSLLQVSEDYYERWPIGTFARWVRYGATTISLTLTAFYVAIISFNQELVPIGLLLRLVGNRTGLPFPALVEALALEAAFEVLREAGLRLPRPIGQAVSIVGVLVLGEAAVRAGVVGPIMIIVVAASALSSFAIPDYSLVNSFRIARIGVIILAGTFGLFGLMWGVLFVVTHMISLRSFGVPYMSPLAPTSGRALMRDGLGRMLWPSVGHRPFRVTQDRKRQETGQ